MWMIFSDLGLLDVELQCSPTQVANTGRQKHKERRSTHLTLNGSYVDRYHLVQGTEHQFHSCYYCTIFIVSYIAEIDFMSKVYVYTAAVGADES